MELIVIIGFAALVLFAVVMTGKISWHFQGFGILALCLLALGVTVQYGPGWFGI